MKETYLSGINARGGVLFLLFFLFFLMRCWISVILYTSVSARSGMSSVNQLGWRCQSGKIKYVYLNGDERIVL